MKPKPKRFNPSKEDISKAVKVFLKNGGEIEKVEKLAYTDYALKTSMFVDDKITKLTVKSQSNFLKYASILINNVN